MKSCGTVLGDEFEELVNALWRGFLEERDPVREAKRKEEAQRREKDVGELGMDHGGIGTGLDSVDDNVPVESVRIEQSSLMLDPHRHNLDRTSGRSVKEVIAYLNRSGRA